MSHEIRTPLNGVIGCAGLLLDTELNEVQREYAVALQGSADHLLRLLSDILDLSKLDAGKMTLEETLFDVRQAISGAVGMLAARAAAKQLRLEVAIDPDVPRHLLGDAARVRQIVLNIVGNAIKFTDAGGVWINVHCLSAAADRMSLGIDVRDTGIGISESGMSGLFRNFSQVGRDTSGRYGGTGLGLAICQRLALSMSGGITVDSVLGQGSTFHIRLVLRRGETVSDGPAKRGAAGDGSEVNAFARMHFGRPLRVLLAEDNRTNQFVGTAMLKRLGCHVDVVENGVEATEVLRRTAYDVVLMDVMMPEMGGIEATRTIRASDGPNWMVPIIAVTANAFSQDRRDCLEAGMSGFLAKPMTKERLSDALLTVLRARVAPGTPEQTTEAGADAAVHA